MLFDSRTHHLKYYAISTNKIKSRTVPMQAIYLNPPRPDRKPILMISANSFRNTRKVQEFLRMNFLLPLREKMFLSTRLNWH